MSTEGDAPPEAELDAIRHEEDRIALLEARERELVALAQRVQADFENHRRRSRDEVAAAAGRGKESLLRALLPSIDNLERALAHSADPGLKAVARQLQEAFAGQGIVVVSPLGEAFDARVHEAIATQPAEGVKSGMVIQVAEAGYLLDGRVLRPARVVVAE